MRNAIKPIATVLAMCLMSAPVFAAKSSEKASEKTSSKSSEKSSEKVADKPVEKSEDKKAELPKPSLPTDVLIHTPAVVQSNFHSPVSQVPEADTLALALAGVGVVGSMVWRRRRQQQPR